MSTVHPAVEAIEEGEGGGGGRGRSMCTYRVRLVMHLLARGW